MSSGRPRAPLRNRVRLRVVARILLFVLLVWFASQLYITATRPPQGRTLNIAVVGDFGLTNSFAEQVWNGAQAAAKELNAHGSPEHPVVTLSKADLGRGDRDHHRRSLIRHLATHSTDLIIDAGLSDSSADITSVCLDLSLPRLICVATSIGSSTPKENAAVRLLPNNESQAQTIANAISGSTALLIVHRSSYGLSLAQAIGSRLIEPHHIIEYEDDMTQVWCALDALDAAAIPDTIIVIGYQQHLLAIVTALEMSTLPLGKHVILTDGFFDDSLQQTLDQNKKHSYSIAFPTSAAGAELTNITDGFAGFGHDAVQLAYRSSRLRRPRPMGDYLREIVETPTTMAFAAPTGGIRKFGLINSYDFTPDYENRGTQFHLVPITPGDDP